MSGIESKKWKEKNDGETSEKSANSIGSTQISILQIDISAMSAHFALMKSYFEANVSKKCKLYRKRNGSYKRPLNNRKYVYACKFSWSN